MQKFLGVLLVLLSCRHMPNVSNVALADQGLNCERKCLAQHIQCLDEVTDWRIFFFFFVFITNGSAKEEQVLECKLAEQHCDLGCQAPVARKAAADGAFEAKP